MLTCTAVITSCNRPKLVMRAVNSVLRQTRVPSELIVVDDCSDTWPHEQLEALRATNSTIQLIRLSSRKGVQVARNVGALAARGDILMYLDDDDEWAPAKCDAQLKQYETDPAIGWAYTGLLAYDETSGERRLLHQSSDHKSGWVWPDILFRNFVGVTSALSVRRQLFNRIGGFDPMLPAMQDYDLFVRLAKSAPVIYDGGHNLIFSAASDAGPKISRSVKHYYTAVDYLSKKYEPDLLAVCPSVRSRMRSQFHILLASKHLDHRQYLRAATCFARALREYPNSGERLRRAAARRLLQKARRAISKACLLPVDAA